MNAASPGIRTYYDARERIAAANQEAKDRAQS